MKIAYPTPLLHLPYQIQVKVVQPTLPKEVLRNLFPLASPIQDNEEATCLHHLDLMSERFDQIELRLAKLEAQAAQSSQRDEQPSISLESLTSIAADIHRLTTKIAPGPQDDIVGSRYVADCLGCTTQWIGEMVRNGDIPKPCMVAGTGGGKLWKFYKSRIDNWLKSR
jgi:predicted DNA-binding transcriptional regulator AlpA